MYWLGSRDNTADKTRKQTMLYDNTKKPAGRHVAGLTHLRDGARPRTAA
jgi:hypothetical protein